MTKLYKIEEFCTVGWVLIDSHQVKLTKEECKKQLEKYLNEGRSPNSLRVVSDND